LEIVSLATVKVLLRHSVPNAVGHHVLMNIPSTNRERRQTIYVILLSTLEQSKCLVETVC